MAHGVPKSIPNPIFAAEKSGSPLRESGWIRSMRKEND